MKVAAIFATLSLLLSTGDAYAPKSKPQVKPVQELHKAAAGAFVALTIAGNAFSMPADAAVPTFSSTTMVSEKVVREGLYREYEIDVTPQAYDDARSTFKSAKETKTKKGKYTALLAILIVGSFIIPMAQYFWYVRDDDSSDRFFAQNIPEPEEPPKKKGWFN